MKKLIIIPFLTLVSFAFSQATTAPKYKYVTLNGVKYELIYMVPIDSIKVVNSSQVKRVHATVNIYMLSRSIPAFVKGGLSGVWINRSSGVEEKEWLIKQLQ